MRAAKLNKRIKIQQQDLQTTDEYNESAKWDDVCEVWAEVRPVTGNSFYEAQKVNSEISHQVIIRYRKGIKPSMRIAFGDRLFEILYVMNFNESNEAIQMLCKELI